MLKKGFLFFLIIFILAHSMLYAFSLDNEVKKIQDAYKDISDIKGLFAQKSHLKDLNETHSFKGMFYIKRPDKMRWEYKGENPQEAVISNNEITIYKKADKQAYKGIFDRGTYGQTPLALLSGLGNLKEEFTSAAKNNKLILTPKRKMGNIVSIELSTSEGPFPVTSFVINDTHSNKIEIKLKNIEINTGLKDSFFSISLPKEASVYEYNP